jgi:hypothetical protein
MLKDLDPDTIVNMCSVKKQKTATSTSASDTDTGTSTPTTVDVTGTPTSPVVIDSTQVHVSSHAASASAITLGATQPTPTTVISATDSTTIRPALRKAAAAPTVSEARVTFDAAVTVTADGSSPAAAEQESLPPAGDPPPAPSGQTAAAGGSVISLHKKEYMQLARFVAGNRGQGFTEMRTAWASGTEDRARLLKQWVRFLASSAERNVVFAVLCTVMHVSCYLFSSPSSMSLNRRRLDCDMRAAKLKLDVIVVMLVPFSLGTFVFYTTRSYSVHNIRINTFCFRCDVCLSLLPCIVIVRAALSSAPLCSTEQAAAVTQIHVVP